MKLLIAAVVAALVLVSAAGSARDFTLRPAAQTDKTVTFSWPRQQGADGYLFLRNGIPVARTMNGSATSATFWRARAMRSRCSTSRRAVGSRGARAWPSPLASDPCREDPWSDPQDSARVRRRPSPKFSLRLVDRTRKTVTFAWAPQPGADGYRFVRDGAVVARTMKSSATTATFWKGSRYAVDVLRLAWTGKSS